MCPVNLLLVPITAISFITDGPPNTHFPLAPVVQDSKTAHKKSQLLKNSLDLEGNQVNHWVASSTTNILYIPSDCEALIHRSRTVTGQNSSILLLFPCDLSIQSNSVVQTLIRHLLSVRNLHCAATFKQQTTFPFSPHIPQLPSCAQGVNRKGDISAGQCTGMNTGWASHRHVRGWVHSSITA